MIRKFGAVDVPPREALAVLLDIESWPEWMPNIRAARILERAEKRILADVTRAEFGATHTTRLEFLVGRHGYTERQVKGIARRWEGTWRLTPAADGHGTVVSCSLDVDLGFYGLLMPGRLVQRTVDRSFEGIIRGIERRAERGSGGQAGGMLQGDHLARAERIRIYATPSGLEVWIDERKYVARPVVGAAEAGRGDETG